MRCMGASTFSLSTFSQTTGSPARATAGSNSPWIPPNAAKCTCCSSSAVWNICNTLADRPKPSAKQAFCFLRLPQPHPSLTTGMQLRVLSESSLTFNGAWALLHATACIVHQHMHHAVLPKHIFGKFRGRLNVRKILRSGIGLIRVLLRHCTVELHLCSNFASLTIASLRGWGATAPHYLPLSSLSCASVHHLPQNALRHQQRPLPCSSLQSAGSHRHCSFLGTLPTAHAAALTNSDQH